MSVDPLKGGSSVSTFILNVRTLKINRGHPEPAGIKHVYQWAEFAIHMEIWRMYGSNVQVNTQPEIWVQLPPTGDVGVILEKVLGVDETEGATMLDQYREMRMCMYYLVRWSEKWTSAKFLSKNSYCHTVVSSGIQFLM